MFITLVLLGFVTATLVTDLREHRIYNWTTYSGILTAFAGNGLASTADVGWGSAWVGTQGMIGFSESLAGCLACLLVMVVCYVFFPGGVGGGDVKLVAMMGAFLGPYRGLDAMLWTFVLGGGLALIVLIWRHGAVRLLARAGQLVAAALRFRVPVALNDADRSRLRAKVLLSPSALVAVCIVQIPWLAGR